MHVEQSKGLPYCMGAHHERNPVFSTADAYECLFRFEIDTGSSSILKLELIRTSFHPLKFKKLHHTRKTSSSTRRLR